MRYFTSQAFDQSIRELPDSKKKQVKKALRLATAFFETGDLPAGLGLKPLRHDIWEIRAGLYERILFHKANDVVRYLIVGRHDDIKQYLRNS